MINQIVKHVLVEINDKTVGIGICVAINIAPLETRLGNMKYLDVVPLLKYERICFGHSPSDLTCWVTGS